MTRLDRVMDAMHLMQVLYALGLLTRQEWTNTINQRLVFQFVKDNE